MVTISIDPEICKHDGLCVQVCPEAVFVQKDKEAPPDPVQHDLCISCGQCVAICPHGALSHSGYPEGTVRQTEKDLVPSYEQLMALLKYRRSYRSFKDKPVKETVIRQIIDAARYAPTAYNAQSTKYLVVQDILLLTQITESTADFLEKMIAGLLENHDKAVLLEDNSFTIANRIVSEVRNGNDMILHNAPALLLFHADKQAGMGGINANLAIQNAAIAAETLGVGAFYTGYVLFACRENQEFTKMLGIPENHEVHGGLALGYPKIKFRKWIERKPADILWR